MRPTTAASYFYFICYAGQAAYLPFLSVFYAHKGLTGGEIGLLAAIGPLMSLLVTPVFAAVADRRGWRIPLLVLSLTATALLLLVTPLPQTFVEFLPLVILISAVATPILSIADGLIARIAERRGLAYGRMRLWGSLSWAIVAAVGGLLWQQVGMVAMFPVGSALLLASVIFARKLEDYKETRSKERQPLKSVIADNRFRVVLVSTFVLGLALAMTITFTAIYMDQVGGRWLVGLFAGVMAISELPSMHWGEGIMRRLGGPTTLALSYLLFGVSYLCIALTDVPLLLLGAGVIQGVGFGLFFPTTVRLVSDWGPPEWSSTSQGLMNAGLWGLAPLVASPVGGVVYDALGPAAVFLACVGATVVAALLVVLAQVAGVFQKKPDFVVAPEGATVGRISD